MKRGFTLFFLLVSLAVGSENRPRNIVFMLADDLGPGDLSCYGQKRFQTPNIDRLAAEGLMLTQHYSGAPVCAPSRCVLLTGQHLGRAEIRGNMQAKLKFPEATEGQLPISAEVVTLPQTLQEAGFRTAAVGKWGLGPVGSSGDPNKKGFDYFFGYNCQYLAHSYWPEYLWKNAEKVLLNQPGNTGHVGPVKDAGQIKSFQGQKYAPLEMLAEAEKFLAEQKSQPKPFFLYLAFIEPHVALHPPEAELEKFPAEWDQEPYLGQCGYLPHKRPRAAYAAMVTMLDGYVGRVLAALQKHGLAEDTLVVFTSDNGPTLAMKPGVHWHSGGADCVFFESNLGRKGYKGSVTEGGIHVPCLVRLPGVIPAGKRSSLPSYFADWFPTLLAALGKPAPAGLDGENLWPALTSGAETRKKPMVWVFPEGGGQVAVRVGDYKLVREKLASKKPGPWQLYDMANDPNETKNLASEKPQELAEAIGILQAEMQPNANFPVQLPVD
jgi:arylsulfatase A